MVGGGGGEKLALKPASWSEEVGWGEEEKGGVGNSCLEEEVERRIQTTCDSRDVF